MAGFCHQAPSYFQIADCRNRRGSRGSCAGRFYHDYEIGVEIAGVGASPVGRVLVHTAGWADIGRGTLDGLLWVGGHSFRVFSPDSIDRNRGSRSEADRSGDLAGFEFVTAPCEYRSHGRMHRDCRAFSWVVCHLYNSDSELAALG